MRKIMYALIGIGVWFAGLLPLQAYDSLVALNEAMEQQRIDALKQYIAENPDAPDRSEAEDQYLFTLIQGDEYDEALSILTARYKKQAPGAAVLSTEEVIGEMVAPIVYLYTGLERRDEAREFLKQAKEDFSKHPDAETIQQAFEEIALMLNKPGVGDTIEISFTSLGGEKIDLKDYEGKVVLVDYWATWCIPCLRMLPALKDIYAKYHEHGFEILGISLDDDESRLTSFLEREKVTWPQYFDGKGWENDLALKYSVQSIPATFLIGPDGTVISTDPSTAELRTRLSELLAEAPVDNE